MGFRKTLKGELDSWLAEGLVDESQASKLTARYRLDDLERESRRTLLAWFFLLGAVLIGCGVTAFVAAHWDEISKGLKAATLIVVMLAVHAGGYYLWRIKTEPRAHLGHALTVLGTLIFGANIGLFAQIFHISGHFHEAFLAWGVGAFLMAWALMSVPNAVVSICAAFIGFVLYVEDFEKAFLLFSLVVTVAFLPLCYLKRSGFLFFLTIVAAASSLIINGILLGEDGWYAVYPFIFSLTALWGFGLFHHEKGRWPLFGLIARQVAAFAVAGTAYVLSFHELIRECAEETDRSLPLDETYVIALVVPMAALAFFFAARCRAGLKALKAWIVPLAALALLVAAAYLPQPEIWSTVVCNVAAFVLAGYGIGAGLLLYRRLPYWAGLAFMVLLISSRFFEYESHLMIKSGSFIVAGLALILGGIKFENRLRARKALSGGGRDE